MAVNDIVMGAAGASGPATYVEDVFSTWLYTGNGSTQTITNGIDLSGKGGLVWAKKRNSATDGNHILFDTARGQPWLSTNNTSAQLGSSGLINYNSNGFGWTFGSASWNSSGDTFASWTFREQAKFFDIVTWTGDGANPRQIAHNLGSVPGCIIIKSTTRAENWTVYHQSLGNTGRIALNTTAAAVTGTGIWANTTPTSTYFTVTGDNLVNFSGDNYVAYLFAHNAGGFGATGTDNVISCGSFAADVDGNATVNLGYEPQWLMFKISSADNDWKMRDNMRGFFVEPSSSKGLIANAASAESDQGDMRVTNTGFSTAGSGGLSPSATYIYIAIRRPMKTPTVGTSVFKPYNAADTTTQTVGFPTDMYFDNNKTGAPYNTLTGSRLIGTTLTLSTSSADVETTSWGPSGSFASNTTFAPTMIGAGTVWYSFRRAAGFFDVVCYVGGGNTNKANPHNLGVVPELIIVKERNNTRNWGVYVSSIGRTKYLNLDDTGGAVSINGVWGTTNPTSTNFYTGVTGANYLTNEGGYNYVAYLFATVAGVSKVGSYTGTGATLNIDAGFTTGARFVMIKRTDASGSWFVWDTARGMVAGTDPRLGLNLTTAESNADWVYTASSGFQIVTTDASINASGSSYIYLAIA